MRVALYICVNIHISNRYEEREKYTNDCEFRGNSRERGPVSTSLERERDRRKKKKYK